MIELKWLIEGSELRVGKLMLRYEVRAGHEVPSLLHHVRRHHLLSMHHRIHSVAEHSVIRPVDAVIADVVAAEQIRKLPRDFLVKRRPFGWQRVASWWRRSSILVSRSSRWTFRSWLEEARTTIRRWPSIVFRTFRFPVVLLVAAFSSHSWVAICVIRAIRFLPLPRRRRRRFCVCGRRRRRFSGIFRLSFHFRNRNLIAVIVAWAPHINHVE